MRITLDGDYEGEWWLPERPEEKVPGILRVGPDGAPTLKLLGRLGAEVGWTAPPPQPAIMGDIFDVEVSLWRCVLVAHQSPASHPTYPEQRRGVESQTYEAIRLIVGGHFPDPDEPFVRSAIFRFSQADTWCSGLLHARRAGLAGHYQKVARIRGATFRFVGGMTSRVSPVEVRNALDHQVWIHASSASNLDDFYYQWVRPLRSYISLAVDADVAVMEQHLLVDESSPWHRAQVFTRSGTAAPAAPVANLPSWNAFMRLGDGLVEKRLRQWFRMDAQGAAHGLSNLTLLHSPSNTYTSNRLLNVATALESLQRALGPTAHGSPDARLRRREIAKQLSGADRQWFYDKTQRAASPSFISRLHAFVEPIQHVAAWLVIDVEAWAEQLRDARNGLAHALHEHMESARDVRRYHALTEVSAVLGVIRLMHELHYSDREILDRLTHAPRVVGLQRLWEEVQAGGD